MYVSMVPHYNYVFSDMIPKGMEYVCLLGRYLFFLSAFLSRCIWYIIRSLSWLATIVLSVSAMVENNWRDLLFTFYRWSGEQ